MTKTKPWARELVVLGALAINWLNTSHSNEIGHDHHCSLEGHEPGDPLTCTCGWSTFYSLYLELEGPRVLQQNLREDMDEAIGVAIRETPRRKKHGHD